MVGLGMVTPGVIPAAIWFFVVFRPVGLDVLHA